MLCFRKFPVAKKFMDRRGEYQDFRLNVFSLTVPKQFVREPFSVSLISCIEKLLTYEGQVTTFYRKVFLSQ